VAVVQYTFRHKQYTEHRERNIHNNKNIKKIGKCGPCPVFVALLSRYRNIKILLAMI
jgi:hypothetical protein